MIKKVQAYMFQHKMIERGDRVIVGVSGGADSMALLSVLDRLRNDLAFDLVVAHLNHGLRGREADEDAIFVKKAADAAGLPFFDKKLDIEAISKQKRLSLEDAARQERYLFFHDLLRRLPADRIALGHQRHDQTETVLLNFLRGAGSRGLRGILPVRDHVLIRPFLNITRHEILTYLDREKIAYREDESNRSDLFLRNRIRHDLLPSLKHYNARIEERLYDLAETMRTENDFLEAETAIVLKRWFGESHSEAMGVNISDFLNLHGAIQRRAVKTILENRSPEQNGINQVHVDAVIRLFKNGHVGQKLSLPFATEVFRDYDRMVFRQHRRLRSVKVTGPDAADMIISEPEQVHMDFDYPVHDVPAEVVIREKGQHIRLSKMEPDLDHPKGQGDALLDFDKIEFPVTIRNFRPGDRFHPLGMTGTKKLKSLFIDRKIPKEMRQKIPLLADRTNILWIAGVAISDLAKVTPSTRICLKIEII